MTLVLRDYQKSLVSALGTRLFVPGEKLLVQVATGGGKTAILNEFLAEKVRSGPHRVLVVTKDWTLLAQAAWDFVERYSGRSLVGYVGQGPEPRRLFDGLEETSKNPITYTTIQSWKNRAKKLGRFDFVVIDELHWGEEAPLYSDLMTRYAAESVFIGFTATPRKWTSFQLVDKAYDFGELLKLGYLATPIIEEPRYTNVSWSAERNSEHSDFTQASLRELAVNESRNRLIVKTYLDNHERYGKTLVFACNIDHAELLKNRFTERGVRAGVVHHKIENRQEVIEDFDASELEVLVNVSILTHGVDIPSIRTVLLARPTTSDILFSQMVGRGARKIEGKDCFYLVDFVDNVLRYGVPIVRPDGFFGIPRPKKGELQRGPTLDKHAFTPAPFVFVPQASGYEALAGLDVQPEQTFGLEFEVARRDGVTDISNDEMARVFGAIKVALEGKVVIDRQVHDHSTWTLKRDSSCGLEVTTRVLKGVEGFQEVYDALEVLRPLLGSLGYRVDKTTGTHLHLGWSGVGFGKLKELFRTAAYYEPVIYSLVAPSRVGNSYAVSVRHFFKRYRAEEKAKWRKRARHYQAINFERLFGGQRTVEIRYHNGTLEGAKILVWVSLWMRIFDRAQDRRAYVGDPARRLARSPLCPGNRGEVLHLATYVGASSALRRALVARRKQILEDSWVSHEKYGKLAQKMLRHWG